MRPYLIMTAAVFSLLVIVCLGQSPASEEAVRRFQEAEWRPSRSLAAVPREVLDAVRSRFGEDSRLADVGEPFDGTDVLTGLSTRRLVLAGQAGSDWFIVYEQGGRSHRLVFVMFDTREQPLRPLLFGSGGAGTHDDVKGWQLDVSQLKTGFKRGGMQWSDPESQRY